MHLMIQSAPWTFASIKWAILLTSTLCFTACGTTSHTTSQAAKPRRPVFVPIPSTPAPMSCANHTNGYIHSYAVQEPRTMARDMKYSFNCFPNEMGNSIVAAGFLLPDQWQPGMKVKVRWKPNAHDWIEKTTTIPRYDRVGTLFVHFFDNDEVRVVSAFYFPRSTLHPILSNVTTAPPEVE
ncbi:DUF3304 domain-containing protein [Glaciimonas sp. CA11.2]|uniref:DUF3304 domain-containing protein n=1 Tax=Glaciimonas sp. CA11.2 TaxID=3048601 RepID=UPI002AB35A92|nr:DUF3304 domain-containing protein [Glaciimonas sp. CA11.2]MDY7548692.1 DUF3304 domain-containing protein [Glaciimonas sp. CA11.2]MEB0164399.1 DUF3304 domain-containing protein [Glaciimonas sp. CA11.2]